jgi:RimJ/RimL family protein N-acetyltransferase
VLLTAWTEADVPAVLELADDPATRAWSPSLRAVATEADARAWLGSRVENPDRYDWAVRDPATGRLIGRVGLHRFDPMSRNAEIGYGVHPAHRRGGVAVRAVAAASGHGFAELGLARIGLIHAVGNTSSCAVAARSGFAHEGVVRSLLDHGDGVLHDVHLHGRLSTDPPGPVPTGPAPLAACEIRADELLLRPWQPDDAAALTSQRADPDANRWLGPLTGEDAARSRISRWHDEWTAGEAASWAVVDGATGTVLGGGALREITGTRRSAAVVYWVGAPHRRRGVATRTVRAMASYAFEQLHRHRLSLHHAVDNRASCGVARAAGFALEGTTRGTDPLADGWGDEHLHARVATDPPPVLR